MKENKKIKDASKKGKGIWNEFKSFITRGNIVDMAVGVIIGGAFSAILTAFINGILMPVITAAIPNGGVDGLVTVLNHNASFLPTKNAIDALVAEGGTVVYYWGNAYDAAKVAIINWGAFINAVIYFLAVALILFIIVKVVGYAGKKRMQLEQKMREEHYKKHPEDRPEEPKPEAPVPTELDVLNEILEELKSQKKGK
ncbi:MAG: large conductance mechanosensitive channel protein MscL [Bacilli bacterium]|nr:large conductance mechanosensitive channel protein MscL [Bacilli bacterium]